MTCMECGQTVLPGPAAAGEGQQSGPDSNLSPGEAVGCEGQPVPLLPPDNNQCLQQRNTGPPGDQSNSDHNSEILT